MRMQKIFIAAGIVSLIFAGWMSVDMITSSILVDGSSWNKSSLTGDRTYSTLMFTNDRSVINLRIDFTNDVDSQVRVLSSSPVGIREFSSQITTPEAEAWRCMFVEDDTERDREDEISTSGLWSSGNYTGVRGISGNLTTASTEIDGSGMVSLSKHTRTMNVTKDERSYAAGKMNVSEYVEYRGGI